MTVKNTKTALIFVALAVTVTAQDRPDRSRPPQLGPAPPLRLPPIQKRTLSNGLAVWLVESHEVPLVQVNLVVLAGSGDDPAGTFGAASLTAAMLDEGAGTRSALDIADVIELPGATLATTSAFDASTVRLNVPVSRLQDALPVMADVALRPTFPGDDLDRLRQERLTALLQARDDPQSIAAMSFSRIVFGAAHRYGTGAVGTEATLKAFSAQDLRAFHSGIAKPIPADELAKAKNYIALGFPAAFETAGDLSRGIEDLILYTLPEDYLQRYVANVQAVTADAAQKAAARYIQPSRCAVVVVGDRKTIEPGIRALNLGPVRVMTVEEALGL